MSSTPGLERLADVLQVSPEVFVEAVLTDPDVLKAVRGGVAEVMASRQLVEEPGVVALERSTVGSDRLVTLSDDRRVRVEVKVVDAAPYADGTPKVDVRRSTGERLYHPDDFEVLAACLLPLSGTWEYRYRASALLARRTVDGVERIDPNVRVTADWATDLHTALAEVPGAGFAAAERARPAPQLEFEFEPVDGTPK